MPPAIRPPIGVLPRTVKVRSDVTRPRIDGSESNWIIEFELDAVKIWPTPTIGMRTRNGVIVGAAAAAHMARPSSAVATINRRPSVLRSDAIRSAPASAPMPCTMKTRLTVPDPP